MKADDTAITHEAVTVAVLRVDGQPMSASMFRQLPKKFLVNRRGMKLNGVPWGRVNYYWGSCNSMHLHIVWVDGEGTLYRDCVYATRGKNEPPDHAWVDLYQDLQKLPQLYISGTDGPVEEE